MQLIVGQGHLPRLGEHQRVEVGNELQAELVELVDLSLLGKQLHWSVVGPNFRSLHLQLDELVDSWRELADGVAERAIAIGAAVDGQARTVAADSPLAGVEPGAVEDAVLVRELAARLSETAERTQNCCSNLSTAQAGARGASKRAHSRNARKSPSPSGRHAARPESSPGSSSARTASSNQDSTVRLFTSGWNCTAHALAPRRYAWTHGPVASSVASVGSWNPKWLPLKQANSAGSAPTTASARPSSVSRVR